jgi:YcxB-like protein
MRGNSPVLSATAAQRWGRFFLHGFCHGGLPDCSSLNDPRFRPRTLTVDAIGAHWHWFGGSSVLAWKSFIRWHEGKNEFVLYTSPATFDIVPKRAFSEEELKDFRGLLSQEISSQNR